MSFAFSAGRVQLRQLRPTDLPDFLAYRSDPAVARFQGFDPYDEAEAAAFIANQAEAAVPAPAGEWVQMAIARTEDDVLVGDCALHRYAHEPRFGEMGITLSPRWQGQGYARAALAGLLRYCFTKLELHRVVALTDTRNLPCVALLEGVGMRREGHFLQNGWYKGEWCDEYQYALLRAEWAARP
jgi:ribosomal-protein-alanine N-acetyltransferase